MSDESEASVSSPSDDRPSDAETIGLVSASDRWGDRDESPIGDRLGRYLIIEEVGRGAMGSVLRAYDPKLCREVALKRVVARGEKAEEHRARVLHEARAMASLAHANVVPVFDVEEVGSDIVISMEFVHGQTLGDWFETQPSWREVVTVFSQAGRGLQAAHEAGLIHRDFKPANVLLGEDRRARVTDFGLARLQPGSKNIERRTTQQPGDEESIDRASRAMTREGRVVGSPGYMAPEAMMGADPDAVSDIYSFCVALYEGLHGARPFAAKTFKALAKAKSDGIPTAPEKNRGVPRSIHATVMRGLHPDPRERWQTMAELVAELQRSVSQPRRRAWQVAGVLLVGGVGTMLAVIDRGPQPCEGGSARVEAVWNGQTSREIADQLARTGAGFAEDTSKRVAGHLDAYAADWVEHYREACAATHVLGEQSERLLDLRMRCLDRRLDEFGAVVEVLESSDAEGAERAVQTARSIPTLDACRDVEALESGLPPPDDPEAVREARKELARISALLSAGRGEEALAAIDEAREAVDATGYRPLQAELRLKAGAAHRDLAHDDEFFEAAFEALNEARATGHRKLAAQAAISVAEALRAYPERRDELERALAVAAAEVEAAGETLQQISLALTRGSIEYDLGHYAEAELAFRTAHELQRDDPPSPTLAKTISNLANSRVAQGYVAEAEQLQSQALKLAIEVHGPQHPQVSVAHQNLAAVYFKMGQIDNAEFHTRGAIRVRSEASGARHPAIPGLLGNLAAIQLSSGKMDEGVDTLERALEASDEIVGEGSLDAAMLLNNLVAAHTELEHFDRAQILIDRLLKLVEPLGPGHPMYSDALGRSAYLQTQRGDVEGALRTRRELQASLEASAGPDHLRTIEAMLETCAGLRKVQRPNEALELALEAKKRLGHRLDDPLAPRAFREVGMAADATGDRALALESFQAAVKLHDATDSHAERAVRDRIILAKLQPEPAGEEARELLARAADDLKKFSADDPLVVDFVKWLGQHSISLSNWPPER